jgi:hypothetical protein
MKNKPSHLFLMLFLLLAAGLACSSLGDNEKNKDKPANETSSRDSGSAKAGKPRKLDSYSIKGIKFVYFMIPVGLTRAELIDTAQKLHQQEPDAQLILVDDDSELADYVSYAKAISGQGELDKPQPVEWADKHIIANVQKYMNGRFVLCEGNGSAEITDLK